MPDKYCKRDSIQLALTAASPPAPLSIRLKGNIPRAQLTKEGRTIGFDSAESPSGTSVSRFAPSSQDKHRFEVTWVVAVCAQAAGCSAHVAAISPISQMTEEDARIHSNATKAMLNQVNRPFSSGRSRKYKHATVTQASRPARGYMTVCTSEK